MLGIIDPNLDVNIETISPIEADKYLKKNIDGNRPISQKRVNLYKEEMIQGKWQLNGDAIRFDINGRLIDGQHRLRAIMESGVSIQCLVVRGLHSKAISTVDLGKRRSTADILHMEYGILNGRKKLTIANGLMIPFSYRYSSPCGVVDDNDFTDHQKIDFFLQNQNGIEFVSRHIGKDRRLHRAAASVIARAYYHEEVDTLNDFLHILFSGYYRDESQHAAQALRNYLMTDDAKNPRQSFTVYWKTQTALRAFLKGHPLKNLKARDEGASVEKVKDIVFWMLETDRPYVDTWEKRNQNKR